MPSMPLIIRHFDVDTTLGSIPVVGGLLKKLYENCTDSNEDKTEKIIQILKNFEQMDEYRLEQELLKLEKNRKDILKNRNYLKQLVYDTSKILDELYIVKQDRGELKDNLKTVDQGVFTNQKLLIEILNRLKVPKDISSEKEIIIPNTEAEQIKNLYKDIMSLSNDDILKLANTFYFMKKFDQAISLYDRILVQNPNTVMTLNNKGATLYYLGKIEEAILCFDKVLAIDPKNISALDNQKNIKSLLEQKLKTAPDVAEKNS